MWTDGYMHRQQKTTAMCQVILKPFFVGGNYRTDNQNELYFSILLLSVTSFGEGTSVLRSAHHLMIVNISAKSF